MPENPLLPNRKLQELYSTMLRARALGSRPLAGLEAVLATVAQQLEPGDALVTTGTDSLPAGMFASPRRSAGVIHTLPAGSTPLAFAAGVATAAQLAAQTRLAVTLLDVQKPEPAWPALLAQAQHNCLPLIIVCPDQSPRARANTASALAWPALSPVVSKLRLAVLTVDGGDAVAMYRAMQESVLRARHGDGPALLWCLKPDSTRGANAPVERLQRYMAARKIAVPTR